MEMLLMRDNSIKAGHQKKVGRHAVGAFPTSVDNVVGVWRTAYRVRWLRVRRPLLPALAKMIAAEFGWLGAI